jgi:hypothetical protein
LKRNCQYKAQKEDYSQGLYALSRSARYFEYFALSANSSRTTNNLFPLELTACTTDRSPRRRKESNQRMSLSLLWEFLWELRVVKL